jgi:selenocysteine lyase/cysteine desulfurase
MIRPITITFILTSTHAQATFAQAMYDRGWIVKQAGRSASANEGGPTMPLQATRITFHLFNTKDDVAQLVDVVAQLFASGPQP